MSTRQFGATWWGQAWIAALEERAAVLTVEARKAIEKFVGRKVFLDLKVKVDEDWRGDDRKLRQYGY